MNSKFFKLRASFVFLALSSILNAQADSPKHAAPKSSAAKALADVYGCESQISPELELELIQQAQDLDAKHLAGRMTVSEINIANKTLETRLNPTHDPAIAERLNLERNLVAVADTNKFLFSLLVKRMSGESKKMSQEEKNILLARAVPREVVDSLDATLDQLKVNHQPDYNALLKVGAKFDKTTLGWDFSDSNFNASSFNPQTGNPALIRAMDNLVGLGLSKSLADPDRTEAVIMGDKVFLPTIKNTRVSRTPGTFHVTSLDTWQTTVNNSLNQFNEALGTFASASKVASTVTDLRRAGSLSSNTGKKEQTKTLAQTTKEAAYQDLLGNYKILKASGVNTEMARSLLEVIGDANRLDVENIDNATRAIDSDIKLLHRTQKLLAVTAAVATGGVLLAPVAAGAAAGGVGGALAAAGTAATTTSTVATSTGFMLTAPTLISGATSLAKGAIDKDGAGGSLFCRFHSQFERRVAGSLYMGSAFAIIPGAAATGGGIVGVAGAPLAGAVVEGGINLTVGGVLTGSAGISGAKDLLSCYGKFKKARALIHQAAADGSSESDILRAKQLNKEAQEDCVDAGVNLATVAIATKGMTREGLKTLDVVYQKSPGFREFSNRYLPLVKSIKGGQPITRYEAKVNALKASDTPVSNYFKNETSPQAPATSEMARSARMRKAVEADAMRQEQSLNHFMKDFRTYAQNVLRVQGRGAQSESFMKSVEARPLLAAEAAKSGLTFRDFMHLADDAYFEGLAPKPTAPGPLGTLIGKIKNPTTMAVAAVVGRTAVGSVKFTGGLLYYGTIIGTFNSAVSSITNPINNKATQISNVYLSHPALIVAGWMTDSSDVRINTDKAQKVIQEAEEFTGTRKKFKFDGADPNEVAKYWVQMQKEVLKISQEVTNILPGNVNGIRGYKAGQITEPADIGSQLTANVLAYSVHETQVMELEEKIDGIKKAGKNPPDALVKKLNDEKEYMSYAGDAVGGMLVKWTEIEIMYPDSHRDPNVDNGQEVRNKAYDIVRNQAYHYPQYMQKFAPQTQKIFDQLDLRIDVLKRAMAQQEKSDKK